MKRAAVEFAATLAALAAVSAWLQLQDPTSWLRLRLAETRERFNDWRVRAKIDNLITEVNGQ